jgi:hypothetical protein
MKIRELCFGGVVRLTISVNHSTHKSYEGNFEKHILGDFIS